MPGRVVRQFKGIAPRVTPRLLADNQAQSCANVIFKHGSLVPLKANSAVLTLPKEGPIQTIHRFGLDVASDSQYWFHDAADVNYVRGPVAGDTQERTYFTDGTRPRVTDNATGLGTTTPAGEYPSASYWLGVPAPIDVPAATAGGTVDTAAIAEDRTYVVTFVTAWGEEGTPCGASNQVTVQGAARYVDVTLPDLPEEGSYQISYKRIYRWVGGVSGSYMFVGEVPASAGQIRDEVLASNAGGSTATFVYGTPSYYDITGGLGGALTSLDYDMPQPDMIGLTAGPNGVMAGFVGKDIWFCEPYKPHAWPAKYALTVDADIVGIGVFDTTWIVLTKTVPWLISGTDPSNYSMVKSELQQACTSKRSVVSAGGGVIFASPEGLFMVSGSGVRNLTEAVATRLEWAGFYPATLSGYFYDNCYIGFYNSAAGFILDLTTGDLAPLDWYASAGYWDAMRNALFLVTGGTNLVKFNDGSALTMTWKSKSFYTPGPTNAAVARVEAAGTVTFNAYFNGVASATALATKLGISGLTAPTSTSLKYTKSVTDDLAFPLPGGFMAKEHVMEVSGAYEVTSLGMAQSIDDMKQG